jgi:hypothetical protein
LLESQGYSKIVDEKMYSDQNNRLVALAAVLNPQYFDSQKFQNYIKGIPVKVPVIGIPYTNFGIFRREKIQGGLKDRDINKLQTYFTQLRNQYSQNSQIYSNIDQLLNFLGSAKNIR